MGVDLTSELLGEGLVGRSADFKGGESNLDGGRGVVDLGGLAGACETRLDELDRAKEAAAELDRLIGGFGAEPPLAEGKVLLAAGKSEEPGAFGSSIWGVTWLLGALGTSGIVGGWSISTIDMMVRPSAAC